jgi:hypothetical protein
MSLHFVVDRGLALICRLRPVQQGCVRSVVVEFVAARFRFACAPSTASRALRKRILFHSVICIVRRGYCHRTSNRGCQLAGLASRLDRQTCLRSFLAAFGARVWRDNPQSSTPLGINRPLHRCASRSCILLEAVGRRTSYVGGKSNAFEEAERWCVVKTGNGCRCKRC